MCVSVRVYTMYAHIASSPGFSACNIEKLGVAWGQGCTYTQVLTRCKHASIIWTIHLWLFGKLLVSLCKLLLDLHAIGNRVKKKVEKNF